MSKNVGTLTIPPNLLIPGFQREDFMAGNNVAGSVGELGWNFSNGAQNYIAQTVAGHPGVWKVDCTAVANNLGALFMGSASMLQQMMSSELFDSNWIIRLTTSDTNTAYRFGFMDTLTNPPTNGVYVEKLAADTSFFGVSRAASVSTRTAALQTIVVNTWYRFRVRRINSTTLGFSVNNGTEVTLTSSLAAGMTPMIMISNNAVAAAKTSEIDYFDLAILGLTR